MILLGGVSALSVARSVTSVQDSVGSPAYWPYAGAAIAAAAAGFAIAGRRRQGELRGLLTGTAAGLVLGVQDALTRLTVRSLGSVHELTDLLSSWPAYSLIAVGVIALWLMQSAFNSAPLHASLPGVTAAEPVAGIALGVVAFRDKVPASPLLIALQVAGLIALVVGVILVARAPALSGLRQYHVPGEHLLHRDREQRRARDPAAVTGPPPGLAGRACPTRTSPADLTAQVLASTDLGPGRRPDQPDLTGPDLAGPDLPGPDLAGPAWAVSSRRPRAG